MFFPISFLRRTKHALFLKNKFQIDFRTITQQENKFFCVFVAFLSPKKNEKQNSAMGLVFAKYHVQQACDSDINQQLDRIVTLLDSKMGADLTNIVVGFIGHGDIDFVFDDAVKHANSAIQKTGCDTVIIFDNHIDFFGYAYDNFRLYYCNLKWTSETSTIEFETSFAGFTTRSRMVTCYQEVTFFDRYSFNSRIENCSQQQRFTIRIANVGETTHYIIHDDKDRGSRLHERFPLRFSRTKKNSLCVESI